MRLRNAAIAGAITVLYTAIIASQWARPSGGMDIGTAIRQPSCRPLEARLSGWPYAPPPRAGDPGRFSQARTKPIDFSTASLVLIGNRDGAKRRLEQMTSRKDATAAVWSDYAALLHEDAAPGDAFALTTALAAADHALDIQPHLPEALFNRGVILETLSFRTAAAKAYDDYLKVDPASEWSAEVRDRLTRLRLPSTTPWSIGLSDLRHAAASDDVLFINDAAITSPERMRGLADTALVQWGQRTLAHDNASATELLKVARILGTTFEKQSGDTLLAETVRAIDTASDPATLARAHVALGEARDVSLHDVFRGEVRHVSLDHPLAMADFVTCPCASLRYGEIRQQVQHHVADGKDRMPSPRPAAARLRESERLFAACGSPMALVAQFEAAGMEAFTSIDLRRRVIDELSRRTPPRYRLLTAHIESLRARAFVRDGLAREALTSGQAAHDAYKQLGEEWHTNRTRDALAAVYSSIGDTATAWRLRSETFKWTSERENDRQLAYAIYLAASDALRGNRFDLAHSLLNVVVDSQVFDRIRDEALIWRAAAANSAGLRRTAREQFYSAQNAFRTMTDNRKDLRAESLIVAALIDGSPEPDTIWFHHLL